MPNFITDYELKFWVYKKLVIYIFCDFFFFFENQDSKILLAKATQISHVYRIKV